MDEHRLRFEEQTIERFSGAHSGRETVAAFPGVSTPGLNPVAPPGHRTAPNSPRVRGPALLLSGFRPKGPWSIETPILRVIDAWANLYITALIISIARSVDGGTARQPQQRDCGYDQGQLKIGITIDNHTSSHSFVV
jgi:hypothetical protein